ncbi:hypothetical protein [Actinoplanes sp. RD1]|uniref:hypothetical protein n=1 Tax=Actinoplanes sp. RD1 TaxID=3064538 RepID=UPI0027419492|nr:hypothetical protein [Actinoplanes sp. RD1]
MPDKRTKTRSVIAQDTTHVLPEAGEHGLLFSFRYADHGYQGKWAWPQATAAEEVLNFFCHVGASTWHEVRAQLFSSRSGSHRKHHDQRVDSLCPEARQRIAMLNHRQMFGDRIFRFRVGGRKRLWGFVKGGVFYVLWWDPEHQVYPTGKD